MDDIGLIRVVVRRGTLSNHADWYPPPRSAGTKRRTTPAVTGAFVVSVANEKCVRVDGILDFMTALRPEETSRKIAVCP